jgi:hypothetical protein
MLGFIGRHKWSVLGGLGALILVWYLFLRGGSSSSASSGTTYSGATDPATVQAGMQLAGMQLSANAAGQAAQLDYQKSVDTNAASIQLASLSASMQQNNNILAADVAKTGLAVQSHVADLSSQVSIANIGATQQMHAADQATIQNQTNAMKDMSIAQTNASVENTRTVAQGQVANTKASKAWCFITTAVCDYRGEADDGPLLTKFRKFRDEYVAMQDGGLEVIAQYYRVGPLLAEKLRNDLDELRAVSDWWLVTIERHIDDNRPDLALLRYKFMVRNLCELYNVAL